MSTKNAASTLAQVVKDLSAEWLDTKLYWRDEKAAEFESHFLTPLPALISRTIEAMDSLDIRLKKIRSECE